MENWMQFVRYARNKKEQNLIIVQEKSQLFFIAIRDILSNEELLIWYGDFYDLKCGIPSVEALALGTYHVRLMFYSGNRCVASVCLVMVRTAGGYVSI